MNNYKTYIEQVHIYLVLGLLFLCYGIFCLNGYGNDDDIYRVLSTWRFLVDRHQYVPSRFQGYLIPELVIGLSSQIGSFYLSNLVSATLSIATLFIFYLLMSRITTTIIATAAVVAIGTHPFWILASTISMDYIYAIFFFILAVFFLIDGRSRFAGILSALAVSSRLTYAPMAIIAFLFYFIHIKHDRRLKNLLWQGILLFFVGIAILYLPVFIVSGMNFSFISVGGDAAGGVLGRYVRFLYKNIYFWGMPTFILLLYLLWQQKENLLKGILRNPFSPNIKIKDLVFHAAVWNIIYNEIMFAKLPHEYNYLAPILFSAVYLIAININSKNSVKYLGIIFALNIVYGLFCNFDVIETYQTQNIGVTPHADGAYVRFSIKEGVLVKDYKSRAIYQKYQVNEFNKYWQDTGVKLESPW